eukprot:TRINITY_DN67366_c2_g2_i2.p2 TRINITY_DN67366_c2_g2~~TRINITY_DN67366_c2_g2_i2.p2  ORF type:complete len:156 (+),score=23.31 TRINITY_DN67366_c2_g2_i2:739-1206(+)
MATTSSSAQAAGPTVSDDTREMLQDAAKIKLSQTPAKLGLQVAAVNGTVKVIRTRPRGPTTKAIKANDELLKLNDVPVTSVQDFQQVAAQFVPGQRISITVLRNGETQVVYVYVGSSITREQHEALQRIAAGHIEADDEYKLRRINPFRDVTFGW